MTDSNAKTEKYKTTNTTKIKRLLGQNIRVYFNNRDRYSSQNMKARGQAC